MKRWALILAVCAGLIAPLLVAAPASAEEPEGIPVGRLEGCGAPGERGGWTLRQFYATGARPTIGIQDPVRPRSLLLSEPCVSGGRLMIPGTIREVPITKPGAEAPCESVNGYVFCGEPASHDCMPLEAASWVVNVQEVKLSGITSNCVALSTGENTVGIYPPYSVMGVYPVSVAAGLDGVVVTTNWSTAPIPAPQRTLRYTVWCWTPGQDTTVVEGGIATISITTARPTAPAEAYCSGGKRPYAVTASSRADIGVAGTNDHRWSVIWKVSTSPYERTAGGYRASYMTVGVNNPEWTNMTSTIECRSTRTSPTRGAPFNSRYSFGAETAGFDYAVPYVDTTETPNIVEWERRIDMDFSAGQGAWAIADCAILVRITIVVCVWMGTGSTPGCTQTQWESSQWQKDHKYPDDENPDLYLCEQAGFDSEECFDIIDPPYVDPTSWEDVCNDPPGLSFTELKVFPYYMECLFNPQGGWDRDGIVAERWENSAGEQLAGTLGDVAGSAAFYESCGVLISTNIGGAPMQIDTCSWEEWAPARTLLSWGLWIIFGLWAIGFVMKSFTMAVAPSAKTPLDE